MPSAWPWGGGRKGKLGINISTRKHNVFPIKGLERMSGSICPWMGFLVLALLHCYSAAVLSQQHASPKAFESRLRGGGACLSRLPITSIEMERRDPEPFLLCTDLDDTLVGSKESLAKFNEVWLGSLAGMGCKLVYNTGRSLEDYMELRKDWEMLVPDIFIGGCGTQMYSFDDDGKAIVDDKWMAQLGHGWDKEAVQRVVENSTDLAELFGPISQKRESKGNEMMYSCAIKQPKGVSASDAKAKFEALLHQNGMAVNVGAASVSYSAGSTVSGERELGVDYLFIDVLPIAAGKGPAQAYARELLGFSSANVIVAGDSGNDVSMFKGQERGIMVGNAKQELVASKKSHHYHASGKYAQGLLEGLEVYEALPTCGDGHRLLASIHEAGTSTPDRDPPPEYTTKYAGDVEGQ